MIQRGTAFARPALQRNPDASRRLTDKQALAFALYFEPLRAAGDTVLRFPAPGAAILAAARVPPNEDDLVDPMPF